jgi:hypothetical protein
MGSAISVYEALNKAFGWAKGTPLSERRESADVYRLIALPVWLQAQSYLKATSLHILRVSGRPPRLSFGRRVEGCCCGLQVCCATDKISQKLLINFRVTFVFS